MRRRTLFALAAAQSFFFSLGALRSLESSDPMKTPHVLMIVTSAGKMPDGEPTGLWLEEFAVPYEIFQQAGAKITVASIRGGEAPIDPRSTSSDADAAKWKEASERLKSTVPIGEVRAGDFDAVFLPGGHGTMFDFPNHKGLAALLQSFAGAGKPIAAVCHAPAAFVGFNDPSGSPYVRDKTLTAFTDAEERAVKLEKKVPFLLEQRLRELGADFKAGPDFKPNVHRDGTLITGQNPASSDPAARLLLKTLQEAPKPD